MKRLAIWCKDSVFMLVDSQRKVSYRRLLVFIVSTVLLVLGHVAEETWLWLALAYVATEGAQRLASTWKGAKPIPSRPMNPTP